MSGVARLRLVASLSYQPTQDRSDALAAEFHHPD